MRSMKQAMNAGGTLGVPNTPSADAEQYHQGGREAVRKTQATARSEYQCGAKITAAK